MSSAFQFDAVVFDLDGVLIDSEPAHFAAETELLGRYGFALAEDVWQGMKGLTDGRFFRRLRELGLAASPSDEALSEEKLEILLRILPARARPIPGAGAVVRGFAAGRRRLGLATSSRRPVAELALAMLDLGDAFRTIVTGEDVARGKPDPEPFALAARRLGVPAERCVAIEDSVHGVGSAVAAGMMCVAVEHSFPAAALTMAHRVVPTVLEVPAAIHDLERELGTPIA